MKRTIQYIIPISIAFMILAFATKTDRNETIQTVPENNFDWLLGEWKRLNEENGKETFENWGKISPTEYAGIGFTLQNGDTIKQEKMRIVKQDGIWGLSVKVPEETNPTHFEMAELKNDEFAFTNDSIGFPKRIGYWRSGENFKAMVEGEGFAIDFEFERIN